MRAIIISLFIVAVLTLANYFKNRALRDSGIQR